MILCAGVSAHTIRWRQVTGYQCLSLDLGAKDSTQAPRDDTWSLPVARGAGAQAKSATLEREHEMRLSA